MIDKVLAEIARRRELAAKATPGPWDILGIGSTAGFSQRVFGLKDTDIAHIPKEWTRGGYNGDFIADSGTHRPKELEIIEWVYHVAKATHLDGVTHAIERAILGCDEGGG